MASHSRTSTPPSPHTIVLRFLFALVIALAGSLPASGQDASGAARITAVDTGAFPEMSVYLAVNDDAGQHVPGLPASAFSLTEDQSLVSNLSVAETEVGAQMVIVLDTSDAFKARDVNAVTRLDYVKQALTETAWMVSGVDDVSVIAPEGVLVAHSTAFTEVVNALTPYTSTFAGAASFAPFANQALDLASDATPRPGMLRYVILVSNGISSAVGETAVADLAARASAGRIPVYAMYVGPAESEGVPSAVNLRRLAEATGARFLVFENPSSFAPLFEIVANQRAQYRLTYRSTLAVTGQHALAASVRLKDGSALVSESATFPLRVEPAVITIQNLPATIERIAQTPGVDPQTLEPAAFRVEFKADFPDGHPRALAEAQLLVDGQVADTRAAPVEALGWPLTGYAESGAHTLQVRATDELGLLAESAAVTVTVNVLIPPATVAQTAARIPWLAVASAGALIAAGALAVLGFWLARRSRAAPPSAAQHPAALPKTQPLTPIQPGRENKPLATPRLPLPHLRRPARPPARPQPLGQAYLEVLEPGGGGASRADIELYGGVVRLGREAAQTQIVFPDRSVSRRHARIAETAPGVFQIFDEGSTSGTWVNFTQVPADSGRELRDGDVINLGRVQLRFKRRTPPGA